MRRSGVLVALVAVVGAACTEVSSDPNAVVAIRFDGSAYPSIVAGDSLRDSLGTLQPLQAVGLNYKGVPVVGAPFVFSSPDTILRLASNGGVFAVGRKADATPARVFATIGSLQSVPDSLVVVPRADSMRAEKDILVTVANASNEGIAPADSLPFVVLGDTVPGPPKAPIPSWLVSFQLRYKGVLLVPTDTSVAYTFVPGNEARPRIPTYIDTTDASGRVTRGVVLRTVSTTVTEDTIFVIATTRARKTNAPPISKEIRILIRRQ